MTNKVLSNTLPEALIAPIRSHTRRALARVGLRLADSLITDFAGRAPGSAGGLPEPQQDSLRPALAFARQYAAAQPIATEAPMHDHPLLRLGRLARSPLTARLLEDVLLLACLPEAHEGFASLCRQFHPAGQAVPTVALALYWLEREAANPEGDGAETFQVRDSLEDLLCHSHLAAMGLLQLEGDGPWHSRNLRVGAGVWEALMARAPKLAHAELLSGYARVPGLDDWLTDGSVQQAIATLSRGIPCQILLVGGDASMRATRARALLGQAQASAICTRLDGLSGANHAEHCGAAYTAAFMHQACLWLESRQDDAESTQDKPVPELEWQQPILCSAHSERQAPGFGLPLIRLPVEALPATARRTLWHALLPQLGDQASLLAARYPIEPDDARDVVRDLNLLHTLQATPLALDKVGDCIRARTSWHGRPGIQRVTPKADWPALLLPESAREQLQSAVRRVLQQLTVLDDWGFAQGRSERRGVRMLLFGSPGTGKTLAAEVMAKTLGVDLLVVDLASLVSKWIGETEKNLAAVFEIAERSRALLLFDEADALFAKRTDTQDAHDRYANLETAYLLQRLERYEGVAVLTTNLRSNLDKAFARRFEYIIEFPEPDALARESLWHLHLPRSAPLGANVNLAELAAWYPISGAQIKNAALSAAFFAAAAASEIQQHHFLLAIEREYDKAGRAHPGFPPHTHWPSGDYADSASSPPTPPSSR